MKQPKHWHCEMYDINFFFFIGWKPKHFEKYATEKLKIKVGTDTDDFLGLHYRTDYKKRPCSLIWTKKSNDIPCIVHECLHAAVSALSYVDVKFDIDNQEPLAYMLENIVKVAVKRIKNVK